MRMQKEEIKVRRKLIEIYQSRRSSLSFIAVAAAAAADGGGGDDDADDFRVAI